MMKLLIATNNPAKIAEYKIILKDLPLEIVTLGDLNIKASVEEDGKDFEENAIKKAKFYSELTGLPTIAEDSGLEIDYLQGEPGVKSRRWPGYKATDEELINMTTERLKGVPLEKRGAQLRAVIALVINRQIKTCEVVRRGVILEKPVEKIISGYPFRSLFYVPEIKKVLAEADEEEEILISHRKKAIEKLLPVIYQHFRRSSKMLKT